MRYKRKQDVFIEVEKIDHEKNVVIYHNEFGSRCVMTISQFNKFYEQ